MLFGLITSVTEMAPTTWPPANAGLSHKINVNTLITAQKPFYSPILIKFPIFDVF